MNVRGVRRMALLAALSSSAAGCLSTDLIVVPIDPDALEYFFFVTLDEAGTPLRTSAVFGARDRRITFGGSPVEKLLEDESSAVLIGMKRSDLLAIHPGFDATRAPLLTLAVGSPPTAAAVRLVEGATSVAAPLPESAIVFSPRFGMSGARIDDALPSLRANTVLMIPIDRDRCSTDDLELEPFAATGQLLPYGVAIPGEPSDPDDLSGWRDFVRVVHVDRDRVIALSEQVIYLVRRAQPIPALPSEAGFDPRAPSSAIPMLRIGGGVARSIALDRASGTSERITALLVRSFVQDRILELEISNEGVRFTGTATVSPEWNESTDANLDVAIDDRGRSVVVSEFGAILTRTSPGEPFTLAPPIAGADEFIRVIATGDPARPHLVSEDDGFLFLGDAIAGTWESFRRRDRFHDVRMIGLGASPDGADLWAVGHLGSIFRRAAHEAWAPVTVATPAELEPCASDTNEGSFAIAKTLPGVAVDDTSTYVMIEQCSGVLRIRRTDLCASALHLSGQSIATVEHDLSTLDLLDGSLIVGGRAGSLYVLEP